MIIEMDTRNKKDKYVTDYFDKNEIKWIRNKLYAGDVKTVDSAKIIIDMKSGLLELVGNLCNVSEHQRVLREIERAREIGCEEFVFLIKEDKIKTVEDIKHWSSRKTKVKGETIFKIMDTMAKKYQVKFVITSRKNAGRAVIKILKKS